MKIPFLIIAIFMLSSCGKNKIDPSIIDKGENLTIPLIKQKKMKFYRSKLIRKDTVSLLCGIVDVKYNKLEYLTLGYEGLLVNVLKQKGEKVHKGELIAVFKHPLFLKKQSEYLTAKNNFEFYKKEYMRQGELAIEQASSIKKMERSERDYKNAEVNMKQLNAQIMSMGINAEELTPDNITSNAYLFSTVKGSIVKENVILGKYYKASDYIFQVAQSTSYIINLRLLDNTSKLHLHDSLLILGSCNCYGKIIEQKRTIGNDSVPKEEITVLLSDNFYKKGESCQVKIPVTLSYIIIPQNAVVYDNYILVKNGKTLFKLKQIDIQFERDNDYLISYDPFLENKEIVVFAKEKIFK